MSSTSRKWVIGNWKMNGNSDFAQSLIKNLSEFTKTKPADTEVVLCPPFTLLGSSKDQLAHSNIRLGAQDCSAEENGAFTGDISTDMLLENGCEFVLAGHSERRQHHQESDATVNQKAERIISTGMTAVICVGEQLSDRNAGTHEAVVAKQLEDSIPQNANTNNCLIAYEPVWAIGTGKTATSQDIQEMCAFIEETVKNMFKSFEKGVQVLYGGSVKSTNASEILALQEVDGVLVGGACLDAEQFSDIIAASYQTVTS